MEKLIDSKNGKGNEDMRKLKIILMVMILLGLCLSGCGNGKHTEIPEIEKYGDLPELGGTFAFGKYQGEPVD